MLLGDTGGELDQAQEVKQRDLIGKSKEDLPSGSTFSHQQDVYKKALVNLCK